MDCGLRNIQPSHAMELSSLPDVILRKRKSLNIIFWLQSMLRNGFVRNMDMGLFISH